MSNIPDGWIYTLLSEIALIQMGQSPNSRSYNNKGEGLPFFQGKADFGKLFPTVRKWCTEPERVAEEGDILLSVRAPVGPTNLATERCCIGRGLAAIQAIPPFNQKCLLHYFRYIEPWLSQQGTGTTFAGIGSKVIQNLEIPVAPLNEQKRIADKLDSLFARVDACCDRLDRVSLILKRFRQSVLASSTSGKLTEDWREENKRTIENWENITVGELIDDIEAGINVRCEPRSPLPHEQGLVKISAVTWGIFNDSESKTLPPNRSAPESTRIRVGDFLISRANTLELVGACVIVEQVTRPVFLSDKVLRLVMDDAYKEWLLLWLRSNNGRSQIERLARGNQISMRNLTQLNLKSIFLKLPSEDERGEIVRRAKALFGYADRLEVRYQNALKQVEKIKSALLSMAFRGELVPQDPNDEPAAVLLERIRAEQIAKPKQVVVNRKPKMPKMTEESVKEVIRQLPTETFSFDELREKISGDYDSFKDILFTLLSEAEPILTQVFDQEAEAMCFVRGDK